MHPRFSFQSDLSHQLDDKLGEVDSFQAWKYNFSLVLEENELDTYISGEVLALEGDEATSLTQEELGQGQQDHLIPHVSSLMTPKYVGPRYLKEEHKS